MSRLSMLVPVAQPAQAQSLNPVVDVCTGLSLDQSLVTGVVGEVVVPAVTPIQTIFNNLLDLTVNVGPIDVLAPLNIDFTQILANAATAILAVSAQIVGAIPQLDALHPWLFTDRWLDFADLLRSPIVWDSFVENAVLQGGYILVFGAAAIARFVTKDVLS